MVNLTYSSKGTFDSSGKIDVTLAIPKEEIENKYFFEPKFNLSKKINDKQINAIFCQMTLADGLGTELNCDSYDYNLILETKNLMSLEHSVPFDTNLEDSLFLLYHDNTFNPDDVKLIFEKIEILYEMARGGIPSIEIEELKGKAPLQPKKLGLGVIVKS